jgi:hypothetical protein
VKLFGWALILTGGGLVVVGIRQAVKGFRSDEPEMEKVTPPAYDQADWGSDTIHPHDLNDGV